MEADGPDRQVAREVALRSAIVAAPDDDELRLVYADYWEEAGDPERAEYIRLAIEVDRNPDAPGAKKRAWSCRGILDRRFHDWDHPAGLQIGYRRGMVAELIGAAGEIAHFAPAARAGFPIERIQVETRSREHLDALRDSAALAGIRELEIDGDEHIAPDEYPALLSDGLERLEIATDYRELAATLAIHAPPSLQALELHNRGDTGVPLSLGALLHLRELVLRGFDCRFTPPPGLRRLSLANEVDLAAVAAMPALEDLELFDLAPGALSILADAGTTSRLTRLSLFLTPLGAGAMTPVFAAGCPAMRHLRLADTSMGDDDLAALAASDVGPLLSLDIQNSRLSLRGFEALVGGPTLETVTSLDLAANALDESAAAILAGGRAPRLEHLVLDHNPIGDSGLNALLDAGFLDSVVDLSLSFTGVTDTSAVRLIDQLPELSALCLHGSPVSRELAARLDTALVKLYY